MGVEIEVGWVIEVWFSFVDIWLFLGVWEV